MLASSITERLARPPSLLLPAGYMLLIFGLSSIPGTGGEEGAASGQLLEWVPPAVQNLAHIPVYAGLAFVLRWYAKGKRRAGTADLLALLVAIGYGLLDEVHQSYVPGRFESLTDAVANCIGACLGVLVHRWARAPAASADVRC